MIRTEKLSKEYNGFAAVQDVSLQVRPNEIYGFLGPNGAGKTTSFYMIVGLVPMDKGQISLDNQDISFLSMHQRARRGIGYLPQEASIFRKLTVEQNILAILETRQDLSSSQRQQKANDLLEEFHITHIRHSLGMSLSGGERRRVEIARALATEPSFILLDEPFAGVDPISVADIKGIISHLKNRGIGVLITDHHVRETLDICEKAYIVNSGVSAAEGTPKEILANETVRQVYLGQSFSL
ncbi:MAG: LPS export ABC transporter ATP-binding protein [Caldilineaceae bacterium]|nr:LPS export ABC transporter ATP-binding protein [Caldilineaceae bacterium]